MSYRKDVIQGTARLRPASADKAGATGAAGAAGTTGTDRLRPASVDKAGAAGIVVKMCNHQFLTSVGLWISFAFASALAWL